MRSALSLVQVRDINSSYTTIKDDGVCEAFLAGPLVDRKRIEGESANPDRLQPEVILQGVFSEVYGTMHYLI